MWSQKIDVPDLSAFVASLPTNQEVIWLDSAGEQDRFGRFSYVCIDPIKIYRQTQHFSQLRDILRPYHVEHLADGPPFQGGLIGFFDYEYAGNWADGFDQSERYGAYDHSLHLCDTLIAVDHVEDVAWILSAGLTVDNVHPNAALAEVRINTLFQALAETSARTTPAVNLEWQTDISRQAYLESVKQTQAYIRAGDIYQANIAQRYQAALRPGVDPLSIYLNVRRSNPAPFSAFIRTPQRSIACTSPERLVRMDHHGAIEARPIKGTIKRLEDRAADTAQQQALQNSAKDRAENTMIVDLLRNDLSRICEPHSVTVPELCTLESYAGLHQLTSAVRGQLTEGQDGFDLFGAIFPGGSITGAPKARAIEIIQLLEQRARGAFCGAIGYFGFDGAVDLNIMIRTIQVSGSVAHLDVGGGITALSDPDAEYEETLLKAERIMAGTSRQVSRV